MQSIELQSKTNPSCSCVQAYSHHRGSELLQESLYNIGRAAHGLGLAGIAHHYYLRALASSTPGPLAAVTHGGSSTTKGAHALGASVSCPEGAHDVVMGEARNGVSCPVGGLEWQQQQHQQHQQHQQQQTTQWKGPSLLRRKKYTVTAGEGVSVAGGAQGSTAGVGCLLDEQVPANLSQVSALLAAGRLVLKLYLSGRPAPSNSISSGVGPMTTRLVHHPPVINTSGCVHLCD